MLGLVSLSEGLGGALGLVSHLALEHQCPRTRAQSCVSPTSACLLEAGSGLQGWGR